jgi:hypothetical protein
VPGRRRARAALVFVLPNGLRAPNGGISLTGPAAHTEPITFLRRLDHRETRDFLLRGGTQQAIDAMKVGTANIRARENDASRLRQGVD